MKQNYIAVYGLSNNAGIGIVEIDYSLWMLNFEVVVGDKVVDIINANIVEEFDKDVENYVSGFYWGAHFIPLNECMRTNN